MAEVLSTYVAEWERTRRVREGGEPAGLTRRREAAWNRFLSHGFPTTRDEEWRFTSVAPIAEREVSLAEPLPEGVAEADVAPLRLPGRLAAELVFVNGRFAPALSRAGAGEAGVRVGSLADALRRRGGDVDSHLARVAPADGHPFVALNTAFFEDGACIELARDTVLADPVHLLFLATAGADSRLPMAHPRVVVVLGENARASIVESFAGVAGHPYFTNTVTEIVLGEHSVLDHCKLQYESVEAYHIGAIHIRAARSAVCTSHSVSMGGALVRNDVAAVLDGEGVECTLNGLYLADARRLVDHHTTMDHARPHCGSRELYTGILAGHAHGVFNGRIIVRPDAQKTDARQNNRALLLSDDARIDTKPQLEIFANDVKCTHGAAVGQLDDEALFYLRSRGLSDAEARDLLIRAFAAGVVNRLPLQVVRDGVEVRLQRQLARALEAAA